MGSENGTLVVDLWPEFVEFWRAHDGLGASEQVDGWLRVLEERQPAIHERYLAAMAEDGQDWAEDLLQRHWPSLPERLSQMAEVHSRLPELFHCIATRTREALGTDLEPVLVIVPVGYGGWATKYQGRPACDLGLDTIVELEWTSQEALEGLVAHELGHLAHYCWRGESIEYRVRGPLWDIYEEGFAQVCERLVTRRDKSHLVWYQPGWSQWCQAHRGMLAREFLSRVEMGGSLDGFFGSYPECNIEGYREAGYFLGQEVIGEWLRDMDLHHVAVLPACETEQRVRETLKAFATQNGEKT